MRNKKYTLASWEMQHLEVMYHDVMTLFTGTGHLTMAFTPNNGGYSVALGVINLEDVTKPIVRKQYFSYATISINTVEVMKDTFNFSDRGTLSREDFMHGYDELEQAYLKQRTRSATI